MLKKIIQNEVNDRYEHGNLREDHGRVRKDRRKQNKCNKCNSLRFRRHMSRNVTKIRPCWVQAIPEVSLNYALI